jgi:selenide, water dikinase
MSSGSIQKLTANIKAGGCAAKLSPMELAEILRNLKILRPPEMLAGLDGFEDAAVYRISEELAIIQTIDFFPPVVDDPFLFGRIAAVNALSDVYAMGGKPILALNVLGFPTCDYPLEVASRIIEGGAEAVLEAGAVMAGGHSIQTREPIYGMSVTGFVHPKKILTNAGAHARDAIVITKPIGTGVCLLAIKGGLIQEDLQTQIYGSLATLNAKALEIALAYEIHAATDVTGFGLIGHLHEMAAGARLSVKLKSALVPLLPEAMTYAEMGMVPAGAYANRNAYSNDCVVFARGVELAMTDLLFDPQTAGGLLLSCSGDTAEILVEDLRKGGCDAAIIGSFEEKSPGLVEVE